MDIEKVQQAQAIDEDVASLHAKMLSKKDIEVGCASAEEENFPLGVNLDILW